MNLENVEMIEINSLLEIKRSSLLHYSLEAHAGSFEIICGASLSKSQLITSMDYSLDALRNDNF